jgi:hypothetical protein
MPQKLPFARVSSISVLVFVNNKGRQSLRRIQDDLVAFFRKCGCNRNVDIEGFRLLNNPEHCTFNRILTRYPVLDLVLFGGYLLTVL